MRMHRSASARRVQRSQGCECRHTRTGVSERAGRATHCARWMESAHSSKSNRSLSCSLDRPSFGFLPSRLYHFSATRNGVVDAPDGPPAHCIRAADRHTRAHTARQAHPAHRNPGNLVSVTQLSKRSATRGTHSTPRTPRTPQPPQPPPTRGGARGRALGRFVLRKWTSCQPPPRPQSRRMAANKPRPGRGGWCFVCHQHTPCSVVRNIGVEHWRLRHAFLGVEAWSRRT